MFNSARKGFRAGKELPFRELMEDYYGIRGWDAGGKPTEETLKRIGL